MRKLLLAGGALALLATPAWAEPEYVTIEMEIDVDASAEETWSKVGGYCDIGEWFGIPCEITSGEGRIGTVRSLVGGRVIEVLVAQTDLSYGYTQPAVEGEHYNLYHGFLEAKPVTEDTSKLIYTLMYDVSEVEDPEADVARRRAQFERGLARMKEIAEADEEAAVDSE